MSNSNMKGYYNSTPRDYVLEISSMNEAKGVFSGQFGAASSTSTPNVNINGSFSFDNTQKRTVIWFSTSDYKWRLEAPYNRDGGKIFDTWSATRTSASNPSDVKPYEFNVDLSGETDSWFGAY